MPGMYVVVSDNYPALNDYDAALDIMEIGVYYNFYGVRSQILPFAC